MRVLVTGANGFVGSHVVKGLLVEGHEPVVATRNGVGHRLGGVADRIADVRLDLEEIGTIQPALAEARADVIIHCAAYGANSTERDAERMARVNVVGALLLHQAASAAKVARFVHLGTAFEYGPQSTAVTEETPLRPIGMYAATKAAGYLLLRESSRAQGPSVVVLRLFNLFGPGDAPGRIASQIVAGAAARRPVSLTTGRQRRDFSYVVDAARDIVTLATLPEDQFPAGEDFNVASGSSCTVRDFGVALADALDATSLLRFGEIEEREDAPSDMFSFPRRFSELMHRVGARRPCTPLAVAAHAMFTAHRAQS
jgi:nucleoside-diphosphate-sugar epimerase